VNPVDVSNPDRVVFPEIGRTKRDVVAYYERIASRAFPHLAGRPLSIRRYPKGLAAPGFFQKNVPPHYPESIERFAVPRSRAASKKHPSKGGKDHDVTVYPILSEPEQVAYLANQGAIELHVPTSRAVDLFHPDRLVIDLDPPPGPFARVRRAACVVRDALAEHGLASVPIATGSKGYHVVSPIRPSASSEAIAVTFQKFAALLAAKHGEELTTVFRIASRGGRVFVDWLRNNPMATVIVPYSLRARPRATVATPLTWAELETTDPDAFGIDDLDRLLDRPDPLAELASAPSDTKRFLAAIDAAFEASGLVLETFDRFRS
jgi:bifunctional non-homologous end joining protein LigD